MKIACIGDSLTEGDYGVFGKRGIANVNEKGYPYFLAKSTGATVLNYGKCGYTSTTYLEYYKSGAIDVNNTDIILVMLGTNGGLDPKNDVQGNKDYLSLISRLKNDAPLAKIVLITPPHVTSDPTMSNCGYQKNIDSAIPVVKRLPKAVFRLLLWRRIMNFVPKTNIYIRQTMACILLRSAIALWRNL